MSEAFSDKSFCALSLLETPGDAAICGIAACALRVVVDKNGTLEARTPSHQSDQETCLRLRSGTMRACQERLSRTVPRQPLPEELAAMSLEQLVEYSGLRVDEVPREHFPDMA